MKPIKDLSHNTLQQLVVNTVMVNIMSHTVQVVTWQVHRLRWEVVQ